MVWQLRSRTRMEPMEPLKYIEAQSVATPAGRLGQTMLISPTHATLGKLDGVLIDPLHRKVRYYVVEANGGRSSHHYLVPLTPTQLDRDHDTLEVDVEPDEIERLTEVEPDRLPRFSEDDLMIALFRYPAR